MGDEFFAGKAGPAVTSAAAAAAANAARSTNMIPEPPQALNLSDVHSPMKVPVPDAKRKGSGRGGRTQRKAAPPAPPTQDFDPAALTAFGSYPPYGMAPSPYPPAAVAGPCPMPPPPMPMYPMMPFMYPTMYPGMAGAQPPMPTGDSQKGRGKQGKQQKDTKDKKRRGKGNKGGRQEPSPPQMEGSDLNCSPELLMVRNAQGNSAKTKVTLQEALPNLLEFAQDQHGSRFLQNKLDEASPEDRQLVFTGICAEDADPDAASLAKDVSGNFVVQKLFDVGDPDQKKLLCEKLQPEIPSLSKDNYGCRVVQKAIGAVSKDLQVFLASSLQNNVADCIVNMHGNHVIQKCIEQMPPDSVSFIIHAVEHDITSLASHIYGCRVIQRLLEHCGAAQLTEMLERILVNVQALAKNQFGNYVVQHMLEHGRLQDKEVEKCFEIATIGEHASQLEAKRAQLIDAVLGIGDATSPLCEMMTHRYGNYVVQRMMEHSRGTERERIFRTLNALPMDYRSNQHGMHIMNALQKGFREFTPDQASGS
eukprot:s1457_g18.t1